MAGLYIALLSLCFGLAVAGKDPPSSYFRGFTPQRALHAIGALAVDRFDDSDIPSSIAGAPSVPCPSLRDWPAVMHIDAPDPCRSVFGSDGNWTSKETSISNSSDDAKIMTWSLSCASLGRSIAPVTTYKVPSGEFFGTSLRATSLLGNTMELRDCTGYLSYSVEEQIYHVPGEVDEQSCLNYGSCDGTVYIHYVIRNWEGTIVAQTPNLRLFQHSFFVKDSENKLIAEVNRIGRWSPISRDCGEHHMKRQWSVRFMPQDGGGSDMFQNASERWAVAELVTIMAAWDTNRQPSGLVAPSACDFEKSGCLLLILGFASLVFGAGLLLFAQVGLVPLQLYLFDLEQQVCPKRSPHRTGPLAKLRHARI